MMLKMSGPGGVGSGRSDNGIYLLSAFSRSRQMFGVWCGHVVG